LYYAGGPGDEKDFEYIEEEQGRWRELTAKGQELTAKGQELTAK
jgi:hypothetical protein